MSTDRAYSLVLTELRARIIHLDRAIKALEAIQKMDGREYSVSGTDNSVSPDSECSASGKE